MLSGSVNVKVEPYSSKVDNAENVILQVRHSPEPQGEVDKEKESWRARTPDLLADVQKLNRKLSKSGKVCQVYDKPLKVQLLLKADCAYSRHWV